jgi:hypothetical protein
LVKDKHAVLVIKEDGLNSWHVQLTITRNHTIKLIAIPQFTDENRIYLYFRVSKYELPKEWIQGETINTRSGAQDKLPNHTMINQ